MKNQALFSAKDKSKKLKCCLLQYLFGALRVKMEMNRNFKETLDKIQSAVAIYIGLS